LAVNTTLPAFPAERRAAVAGELFQALSIIIIIIIIINRFV